MARKCWTTCIAVANTRSREPGNPAVILLDLKMPRVTGLEALEQIRKRRGVVDRSRSRADFFHRRVGCSGLLPPAGECLCGEAGGLRRVSRRSQEAGRFLGKIERATLRVGAAKDDRVDANRARASTARRPGPVTEMRLCTELFWIWPKSFFPHPSFALISGLQHPSWHFSPTAVFESFDPLYNGWSCVLETPLEVHTAQDSQ